MDHPPPATGPDPVETLLSWAAVQLIMWYPFYGNFLVNLERIAVPWTKTAATDGRHIFYNREYILGLTKSQIIFLLAHEVLHCVLLHLFRREGREPALLNMAADFVVNHLLVLDNVGEVIAGALLSEVYTSAMSTEAIYLLLKKNKVAIQPTLDDHLSPGEGGAGGDDQDQSGAPDGAAQAGRFAEGPPTYSASEAAQIEAEVQDAAWRAMNSAASAGKMPGGLARLIGKLAEPRVDWRALLNQTVRSQIRSTYSFQRPARRAMAPFILPSLVVDREIEVHFFADCSLSMSEQMVRDVVSEVVGIANNWRRYTIHLHSFDTSVYNVVTITQDDEEPLYHYKPEGGGGTLFECIYAYLKVNEIMPKVLVIATDGLPAATWGDATYCETLFLIHNNPDVRAPYGITAHYNEG